MKGKNVTARIGKAFSEELEFIKKERLDRCIDKKKKSTKKLTNLIITHRDWLNIKADIVKVNLENDK